MNRNISVALVVIMVHPIMFVKNNKLIADADAPSLNGLIANMTRIVIIKAVYNSNSSFFKPIMQNPVQDILLMVPFPMVIPPVPFNPGNVPKFPLGRTKPKVVDGVVEVGVDVVVGEVVVVVVEQGEAYTPQADPVHSQG
jgi:hypothetical protein